MSVATARSALRYPTAAGTASAAVAAGACLDDGVAVRFEVVARGWLKPTRDDGFTVETAAQLTVIRSEVDVREHALSAKLARPEQELGIS